MRKGGLFGFFVSGIARISTQIEEIVLNAGQHGIDLRIAVRIKTGKSDNTVRLIDCPISFRAE